MPRGRASPSSREAGQVAGEVTVTGLLRLTEPGGRFLRPNDPAGNRWYSRDVAAIARARGLPGAAPFFIDADASANPGGLPVGRLMIFNPISAACTTSSTASSTSSSGISAAHTSRSGAAPWISETSHSFSALAASRINLRSSMREHHNPIEPYITSPHTPSWSRSCNRSCTSREPGGRCDISAMVSPVAPFAFAIFAADPGRPA